MKKLIFGLLCFIGLTTQLLAQITQLPEIEITAVNYKYLNAVDSDNLDMNVKMLEEKVAMYDIKSSELYRDDFDTYEVSFYIPDGKIVAAYDKNGKIIETIEKFKNVKLPENIRNAVFKRFPNWTLYKDAYLVTYNNDNNKKVYKVMIENGDKRMRLKINADGDFL